jgi:hypothetical protein
MGPAPYGPVLSPLGIFLFHLYFVFMHNLHLLDNAQKYISITLQLKQADNNVAQTMQTRKKRKIPQTSHNINASTSRTIHPTTQNTRQPHHN